MVGRHFKVRMDHQSLKFLMEQKISTPCQQKWLSKLMGYDYEIVYKRGQDNVVADALSRAPTLSAISAIGTGLLNQIRNSWEANDKLKTIVQQKQQDPQSWPHYTWSQNQLKRKGKLVVGNDPDLQLQLITEFHSSSLGGHSGSEATAKRLQSYFYWKKLIEAVDKFMSVQSASKVNMRPRRRRAFYSPYQYPRVFGQRSL